MSHAETEKKHNDAMALIVKQLRDYYKLLAFIRGHAMLGKDLDDMDEMWSDGENFSDGVDYCDTSLALECRELLKEIGEAKDE